MGLPAFVDKSRNRLGSSTAILGDHVCPLHPGSLTARETVHDENQTAYLPLLRHLDLAKTQEMTSKQTLEIAVHLITTHQLLPELSTFHLALALHTTVPRIEVAYSWYSSNVDQAKLGVEDCASWVEWSGKGYCDVESLRQDLDSTIGYTSDS
jgi:UDP-glucose:glycoprotein glucosyltransferase